MSNTPDKIRNVMLAGHSSGGKTSLAEALLFATKGSDRLGDVADGNTVTDFDPEEIKRKASISTALAPVDYAGCRINLIDTPGLFDFELGTYEGVMAAETVCIAISARSGVSVGTVKANKLARKNNKARMFYISKIGVENADYDKTLEGLRSGFGPEICPLVVPILEEGKPTIYVDLLHMKAFTYSGGKPTEVEVPKTDLIDKYLHELNEAVAESDEELLEKFIMEEPFTRDELIRGLSTGVKKREVAPVVCGDSVAQEAIDLVLDVMANILPSPVDSEGVLAIDKDGNETTLQCNPAGPLAAYIFKTVADPFVGKLSYVKVMSGVLKSDSSLVIAASGTAERLGKLVSLKGKKQTDIKELGAGDIAAITKLSDAKTGDTLCEQGKAVFKIVPIEFPTPSMSTAVSPKKKGDESKISGAMARLMEEDPTIKYVVNSETAQQVLSGMGEQHIDVIVSRLKSKFGVEVDLAPPRVAYRETIRKKVKVQGRHKKQSGGHGQFGDVWIEFEPCDGDALVFEEKVFGGSVPKNFFPAVEKGLRDSVKKGTLAGYPVVGIKATLVDGSYHPVDSSEMAFKTAASIAFKAGMQQASPALLEPIMTVKAYVPDSNTGDIMGEVTKRRGRVLGMNPAGDGLQLVDAEVPESELSDFTTYMRSSTQGRGSFTMAFERYELLPATLEQKVIDEAKALREEEE